MRDERTISHPDALMDRALRGELGLADRAELDRHLANCPDCAAEIEASTALRASMAEERMDDAFNRAAVEEAMARLAEPRGIGTTLRMILSLDRWLRPMPALLGAAALAIVVLAVVRARQPTPGPATVESPSPRSLVLNDGSEILPADGATTIQVAEQTAERARVALRSGSARFRIRHDSRRFFSVDAGAIVVEDLGTIFAMDRKSDGSVRVAVSEGRVAVLYPASGHRFELGAGDERVFFPATEPRKPVPPPNDVPKQTAAEAAPVRAPSRAHNGDEAASLLMAADVARRSANPQAAVVPLRRLVERFPRDPRAASAAFTLGWVLLTDLGRPRDAAVAFAQAERVAPRGALAEDSAARVAEAWQKAGDPQRAAQAARHYQAVYPNGRYAPLMRGLVDEN